MGSRRPASDEEVEEEDELVDEPVLEPEPAVADEPLVPVALMVPVLTVPFLPVEPVPVPVPAAPPEGTITRVEPAAPPVAGTEAATGWVVTADG